MIVLQALFWCHWTSCCSANFNSDWPRSQWRNIKNWINYSVITKLVWRSHFCLIKSFDASGGGAVVCNAAFSPELLSFEYMMEKQIPLRLSFEIDLSWNFEFQFLWMGFVLHDGWQVFCVFINRRFLHSFDSCLKLWGLKVMRRQERKSIYEQTEGCIAFSASFDNRT